MKNLNEYGVQEMNAEEMRVTDGGCFLADAVEAIGEAIGRAWNWLVAHGKDGKTVISI